MKMRSVIAMMLEDVKKSRTVSNSPDLARDATGGFLPGVHRKPPGPVRTATQRPAYRPDGQRGPE